MTFNQGERLQLLAWSDVLGKNEIIARYTANPNGLVYIDATTPEHHAYFEGLGLGKKSRFFELDINNHPAGTVAKAFGLNFDDGAVRSQINRMTDGQVNGAKLLAIAIEGMPGQMGQLKSVDQEIHQFRAVSPSAMVSTESKVDLDKLYSERSIEQQGMEFRDILINEGDVIRHGYAIRLTDPKESHERLAVYAAAMKAMEEKEGVESDRVFGVKLTKAGDPVVICYDATRPPIKVRAIVAANDMIGRLYKVRRTEFDARKPVKAGAYSIRLANTSTFKNYVEAKAVKNLVQRTAGYIVNDPLLNRDKVLTGRALVPDHINIDSLIDNARNDLANADLMVKREIKLANKDAALQGYLTRHVEDVIGNVVAQSRMYMHQINVMKENHKLDKSAESETRQRRVREYSLSDLSI